MNPLAFVIFLWFFCLSITLLIYQQFENPWKKQEGFEEFIEKKGFYFHDFSVDLGASRDPVNEKAKVEENEYNGNPVQSGDHVKCRVETRGSFGSDQRFVLREKSEEELVFDSIEDVREYWENRETADKSIPKPSNEEEFEDYLDSLDFEESMGVLNRSIKKDIESIKNEVRSARDDIKNNYEELKNRI